MADYFDIDRNGNYAGGTIDEVQFASLDDVAKALWKPDMPNPTKGGRMRWSAATNSWTEILPDGSTVSQATTNATLGMQVAELTAKVAADEATNATLAMQLAQVIATKQPVVADTTTSKEVINNGSTNA